MARLLLLRHGQIRANVEGRWHGSTDSPLTWRGRRQADRTARHLARAHPQIVGVYSSPLARCRHTAERVAQQLGLEAQLREGLREYGIGEWEGMQFAHLAETHDFVARASKDPDFAPPGGESLAEVASRIASAVRDIHRHHLETHGSEAQVVLVSHGAAMAVLLGEILQQSPARWTDYHFANCSLTELVLSPAPYVNFFNSTQHL